MIKVVTKMMKYLELSINTTGEVKK